MAFFALAASGTEADVRGQTWVRKVDDLMVVSSDEGVTALFRSTLSLPNLRRKVSEWKGMSAML